MSTFTKDFNYEKEQRSTERGKMFYKQFRLINRNKPAFDSVDDEGMLWEEKYYRKNLDSLYIEMLSNDARGKAGWFHKVCKYETDYIIFFNEDMTEAIRIAPKVLKKYIHENSSNLKRMTNTTGCKDEDGLTGYAGLCVIVPSKAILQLATLYVYLNSEDKWVETFDMEDRFGKKEADKVRRANGEDIPFEREEGVVYDDEFLELDDEDLVMLNKAKDLADEDILLDFEIEED